MNSLSIIRESTEAHCLVAVKLGAVNRTVSVSSYNVAYSSVKLNG